MPRQLLVEALMAIVRDQKCPSLNIEEDNPRSCFVFAGSAAMLIFSMQTPRARFLRYRV